jgi:hypothetical protein
MNDGKVSPTTAVQIMNGVSALTTQPSPMATNMTTAPPTSSNAPPPPAYQPMAQPQISNPNAAIGSNRAQFLLRRPASTESRLILDFFPESWCGSPVVLDSDLLNQVPPVLEAKGIKREVWVEWMRKFKEIVERNHVSCGAGLAFILTVICLPWMYYRCIKEQLDMTRFLKEINQELFEPLGMYFKTQSSSIQIDDYHEDVFWIAIALTPEESMKLKEEEHVMYFWCGNHEGCTPCRKTEEIICCCGVKRRY